MVQMVQRKQETKTRLQGFLKTVTGGGSQLQALVCYRRNCRAWDEAPSPRILFKGLGDC